MSLPRKHSGFGGMRWSVAQKGRRPDNFRTSLRQEELYLLDLIDHSGETLDKKYCGNQDLASFLEKETTTLTSNEVNYLQKLNASSRVPPTAVEAARQSVKFGQPLASLSELETLADEDIKECKNSLRESLVKQSKRVVFRKEVWSASEQMLLQKKYTEQQEKEERKAQSEHLFHEKEKRKVENILGFLFGLKQDKEPETETQTIDDEDESWDYTILGTHPDDEECSPHVLTPPIMEGIRSHLPLSVSNDNFWLKYSLMRDGSSVRVFHDKIRNSSRSIIAIETMEGSVFGAFVSSPWAPRGERFFGTGEAFVWRMEKSRFTHCATVEDQVKLESNVHVYKWSGENRNVQHLQSLDCELIIGGGGPEDDPSPQDEKEFGSALVIGPFLEKGYSNLCLTFKSPILCASEKEQTFEIANMEAWTLTPVDDVDRAEKVELGRRFIFEQSSFTD